MNCNEPNFIFFYFIHYFIYFRRHLYVTCDCYSYVVLCIAAYWQLLLLNEYQSINKDIDKMLTLVVIITTDVRVALVSGVAMSNKWDRQYAEWSRRICVRGGSPCVPVHYGVRVTVTVDLYGALSWETHLWSAQVWHVLTRVHTVLRVTRTFIHKWNKPYLPLLPSRRASPHFGQYLFSVPLRVEGWEPEWLVTNRGGLPARRRSPIPVLTGPGVE